MNVAGIVPVERARGGRYNVVVVTPILLGLYSRAQPIFVGQSFLPAFIGFPPSAKAFDTNIAFEAIFILY